VGRRHGLLWTGVAVLAAGRIIDLVWHSDHPEFETAADQVQAHAVAWAGVLLMTVSAVRAVASRDRARAI
jgi:hypothetical protein